MKTILKDGRNLDHTERQAITARALCALGATAGLASVGLAGSDNDGADDAGIPRLAGASDSGREGGEGCESSLSAKMSFAREVAANALPADVARCDGASDALGVCPERDTCQRYTERATNIGMRTPFTTWACFAGRDLKIEVQS